MSTFDTDIKFLKGVGEKRAQHLNSLGIDTIGALLRYFPRGYEDFANITRIDDCMFGDKVCVKAKIITEIKEQYIRRNMTLYKFTVSDSSGNMNITLFNNKYFARSLHKGSVYLFSGKITGRMFCPEMSSPEIRAEGDNGIRPVYSCGGNISSNMIERLVKTAISTITPQQILPDHIVEAYSLCDFNSAIQNIHFPKSAEALARAKEYFVFEELFVLRVGLMLLKGKRKAKTNFILDKDYTQEFLSRLPFSLTDAQMRTIKEAICDMQTGKCMNRLVQGDVGSGKTAVAAALMFNAARNGYQAAIMAPTEVLAEQHFATLKSLLKNSGISCRLLTGSTKKKEKELIKAELYSGECRIVVGTQALISEDVQFNNLALVITDEQHRFGVSQRARFAAKGQGVHTLVMSATPIPRTLGLIIYGDLDISIIDEYPKGRQEIESYCVTGEYRLRVYNYIKKHLDEGRQGYIVCPMVEENEEFDLSSAKEYFEKIQSGAFKEYSVGLLHGQMRAAEKDKIMRSFKNGAIKLLVCTSVIEVGIDVPNATIMVIENAERFGLSQLHQLRGRIGRGSFKSSCILISDITKGTTAQRLQVIKQTRDGFKIADEDLKLRGPGDFLGSRQHGLPKLKIADVFADADILRLAGMAAANLLEQDPRLKQPQNLPLRTAIIQLYKKLNEN